MYIYLHIYLLQVLASTYLHIYLFTYLFTTSPCKYIFIHLQESLQVHIYLLARTICKSLQGLVGKEVIYLRVLVCCCVLHKEQGTYIMSRTCYQCIHIYMHTYLYMYVHACLYIYMYIFTYILVLTITAFRTKSKVRGQCGRVVGELICDIMYTCTCTYLHTYTARLYYCCVPHKVRGTSLYYS